MPPFYLTQHFNSITCGTSLNINCSEWRRVTGPRCHNVSLKKIRTCCWRYCNLRSDILSRNNVTLQPLFHFKINYMRFWKLTWPYPLINFKDTTKLHLIMEKKSSSLTFTTPIINKTVCQQKSWSQRSQPLMRKFGIGVCKRQCSKFDMPWGNLNKCLKGVNVIKIARMEMTFCECTKRISWNRDGGSGAGRMVRGIDLSERERYLHRKWDNLICN